MNRRILLAFIVAVAALSAGYAAGPDMGGKWSTNPQAKANGGLGSKVLEALTGNASPGLDCGCVNCSVRAYQQFPGRGPVGPRGPVFGPGPRGNCTFGGRTALGRGTVLTVDLKTNPKSNTLGGSLKFHQPDGAAQGAIAPTLCAGMNIAEGTFTGNTFTLKTLSTVHGVKLSTRWKGEVRPDSSMTLEPQDPLPCADRPSAPQPTFVAPQFPFPGGFGGGRGGFGQPAAPPAPPPAPNTDPLVFRRVDSALPGVAGKWVTREPGPTGVLELKASSSGGLTGSFKNICQEERRLEGTLSGKKLTLARAASARSYGETTWTGEMLDENTIRVAVDPPFRCVVEKTGTFVLFRAN